MPQEKIDILENIINDSLKNHPSVTDDEKNQIMAKEKIIKMRLDQLVVDKGLFESRSKAQAVIMAGNILVNEQKIDKPFGLPRSDAGELFEKLDEFVS